jgi:molybdopterin adenylyltransferase
MAATPHPDIDALAGRCAVITVSDTRTPETDKSGLVMQRLLSLAGHVVVDYQIVPDEPDRIASLLTNLLARPNLDAILFSGGTGIAPRDGTYEVIADRLEKTLSGFGELFRQLSYAEIGSRAMASRAIAGTCGGKLIFSMPGSSHAVQMALEKLILPELVHLVKQIQGR